MDAAVGLYSSSKCPSAKSRTWKCELTWDGGLGGVPCPGNFSPTQQMMISLQSIEMDIKTKQEFVQWVKRAVSTSDDCYIELYNLLLR